MVTTFGASSSPSQRTSSNSPSPFRPATGYAEQEFGRPSYETPDQYQGGFRRSPTSSKPSSPHAQQLPTTRSSVSPTPLFKYSYQPSSPTFSRPRVRKAVSKSYRTQQSRDQGLKYGTSKGNENGTGPAPEKSQSVTTHTDPNRNATATTSSSVRLATEEDARRCNIPAGYSLKNWDPSERPILLLGSVFDSNSLGKWIYDWAVYQHGPRSRVADEAGEFWLLLIQLYGKVRRADDVVLRVRLAEEAELLEDFIDSGNRLTEKICRLVKDCEKAMLRAEAFFEKQKPAKQDSPEHKKDQESHDTSKMDFSWSASDTSKRNNRPVMGKKASAAFVDTLLGDDELPAKTQKLMLSLRLFSLRFDANCEQILSDPQAVRRTMEHCTKDSQDQSPLTSGDPGVTKDEKAHPTSSGEPPAQTPQDTSTPSSPSAAAITSDDTDDDTVWDLLPFSNPSGDLMLHKGHPFNQQLPGLVDAAVRQYTAWRSHKECTQPSTTGKRRRGTDGENSGRAGGVSSRRGLGKDSQRDGDDDEEEGDESKSRKRARGPSSGDQPELDDNNATLACPYYKYNKLRHDRCLYLQLRRIKDVKQHLRRAHNQPHFCPICGVAFADSRDDLNEHLIARTCERREFQVPEGVTDSHRAKFTQRVARTLSLSEQWFTVWDILFPGQPRPESPFVEGPVAEVSAEVILWWNRHGRSVVSDHIEANGGAEEFERRVRNYERDLATLFVTVGRDLLGRVVDRMRAGHESGDAATRDSPVASEKHATAETQTALGGSSTSAEAPSSSHVSRDSLDEEREFGKALDRAFAPVAAVAAIAGHDECAVPWQNGQRSSSPVSLLERKANVAAEAEPGFEFSAGALPMWWEMPGFEMDSFT